MSVQLSGPDHYGFYYAHPVIGRDGPRYDVLPPRKHYRGEPLEEYAPLPDVFVLFLNGQEVYRERDRGQSPQCVLNAYFDKNGGEDDDGER